MIKKILSVILAVSMLLSMFPVVTFAGLATEARGDKAKIKMILLQEDSTADIGFKEIDINSVEKTAGKSFFIGIYLQDFKNIYEVANYDKASYKDVKYGLNAVDVGIAFNPLYLKLEPDAYQQDPDGNIEFSLSNALNAWTNRMDYDGSLFTKDNPGYTEYAYDFNGVGYSTDGSGVSTNNAAAGLTAAVTMPVINTSSTIATPLSVQYSGAENLYLGMVEFEFTDYITNNPVTSATQLLGFIESTSSSKHNLVFGIDDDTAGRVLYQDGGTGTEGTTQNIRNVVEFSIEELYPATAHIADIHTTIVADTQVDATASVAVTESNTPVDAISGTTGVYALQEGKTYKVKATPSSASYEFDKWTYDTESVPNPPVTITANGDELTITIAESDIDTAVIPTITAEFKATGASSAYAVTTVAEATQGTVSYTVGGQAVTGDVDEGAIVTIVPDPEDGYEVDTITVTETGGEGTVTVAGDNTFTMPGYPVTVTVTFKLIQQPETTYAITANAATGANGGYKYKVNDGAEVTGGTNGTAAQGDTITVTPDAVAGYDVSVSVTPGTVDVTESNGVYTFTMPGEAVTINVDYTAKTYSITANDNPAGGTYSFVVGGQTYSNGTDATAAEGATFTISATPTDATNDYAEIVVKTGDTVINPNDSDEYTMPASDVTITVTFKTKNAANATAPILGATTSVIRGDNTNTTITAGAPTSPTPAGSTATHYQWYKVVGTVDGDGNSESDDQPVGTGETLTLTDDDTENVKDGDKYYCVITITPPESETTYKPGTIKTNPTELDVTVADNTEKPSVTPEHPTTTANNDGKLTITGTKGADVEYSTDSTFNSNVKTAQIDATSGTVVVSNLTPGTYYVRYKATGTTGAGEAVSATIKNRYSITYNTGLYTAATGLTGTAPETYLEGDSITLTNVKYAEVSGITQGNWTTSSGDIDGNNVITGATGNITVTAHWTLTVHVTAASTGKTDVALTVPTTITFTENVDKFSAAAIDIKAPATDGDYKFSGWSVKNGSISGSITAAASAETAFTPDDITAVDTAAKLELEAAYVKIASTINAKNADYGTYTYKIGADEYDEGEEATNIEVGTSVTITAADAKSVKVVKTGEETTEVGGLTDNEDGTYTFTMPAHDVDILVTFEAPATVVTSQITANAVQADGEGIYNGDYTYKVGTDGEVKDDGTTTNADAEQTVTITAAPNADYKAVVSVVETTPAEGEDATVVDVTDNGDGTYTFEMPDYAVSINVEFVALAKNAITSAVSGNGTFKYTIDTNEYGVDKDATDVSEGTEVTITAEPDTGYKAVVSVVETAPAQGENAKVVTVTDGKFTMPDYAVTINVTFSKIPVISPGGGNGGGRPAVYTVTYNPTGNGSLEAGAKATESVNSGAKPKNVPAVTAKDGFKFLGWTQDGQNVVDPTTVTIRKNTTFTALYEVTDEGAAGLIKKEYSKPYAVGYEDGSFRPQNDITRGELAAMIARLINGDELPDGVYFASFPDVEADAWYNKYIGYLEDKDVLNGYDDGTFRPMDSITRDEISAVITRAQKYAMISYNGEFVDVTEADWAKEYIATLASLNIVTGYEDGSFRPFAPLSRAEAVTIINRVLAPSTAIVTFTPNDIASHWAEDAIILAVNERELIAAADDADEVEEETEAEEVTDEADAEATDEADAEAADETEEETEE